MKNIKINPKTSDNIISIALQSEAVQLIMQTVLDTKELEGEYTLKGEFTLEKREKRLTE